MTYNPPCVEGACPRPQASQGIDPATCSLLSSRATEHGSFSVYEVNPCPTAALFEIGEAAGVAERVFRTIIANADSGDFVISPDLD